MLVKICGLTDSTDALAAAELGAGMLGFNFFPPSPRRIAEPDCERIAAELHSRFRGLVLVGVFVNHSTAEVARIVTHCGLDQAQLSGDESQEALAQLAARGIRAFKAVRKGMGTGAFAANAAKSSGNPALLLDATLPGAYGGTGRTADWNWAAGIAARYPILLAGGLRPENVAEAIRAVLPWGVDAASGVESAPGRKDRMKMEAFLAAVRQTKLGPLVNVEPATTYNAGEILALQKLAYQSEAQLNGDFTISPLTQTLAEMESDLVRLTTLKVTLGGRIIGSVRADLVEGTCRIGRLIVHPEWENHGIGGRLLREIEARFPQAARYELFTSARSARNLYLYRKMGYQAFREQPLNERVTLVYLEKQSAKGTNDTKG
jgi:phosphoribosylanthranilate isomerase